jgi:hypothetical protein
MQRSFFTFPSFSTRPQLWWVMCACIVKPVCVGIHDISSRCQWFYFTSIQGFLSMLILYTYIFITHYKSLISILSINKYDTSSRAISSFSIEKYYWKIKEHVTLPYAKLFSILKIILKIQENHIMSHHISYLKNNSKNSSSMTHHLIPRHYSLLKTNSKNLRKSLHTTSPFSIEK